MNFIVNKKIENKKELENILSDYKKNKTKMKDLKLIGKGEEAEKYRLLIDRIDNALDSLDDKQREIIKLRYIEGMGKQSWKLIAESLYISNTTCHVLKNKALDSIFKLLIVDQNGIKTV
ncbi:RNA polymerase sigma factor [Clostridium perfringens]|uniref:RNA polymerase sigma factor n=1 Tax=Clostridium perfringens TaxID=1502 RepID=UPI001AD8A650|nr:sigma factor-like helix-turn-helix DNA-binding protein [Clostridium perfringens]